MASKIKHVDISTPNKDLYRFNQLWNIHTHSYLQAHCLLYEVYVEELHVSHKQSNGVTLLGVVHVWEMDYSNSMNTEATQRQANSVVSVLTCNWKVNYHSQVLHKEEELQERTENKEVRVKRTGNDCSGQFQFYLRLSFTTWQQSVCHDCCLPPWHYPLTLSESVGIDSLLEPTSCGHYGNCSYTIWQEATETCLCVWNDNILILSFNVISRLCVCLGGGHSYSYLLIKIICMNLQAFFSVLK